ncbi:site-specific DNA-methyltransferase [Acetobacteraceae bacterium]|nr:site-specific DNA-methyltransferase [Acetobacteraceae bacterium]
MIHFSQEPRAKSQEPRAKSQEPRAKSQEPRAKSQEPRAKSQEPRAKSQEPRAKSQEPRAKSQEPRAKSQEPRAKSQEPRAKSQEPYYTSETVRLYLGDCLELLERLDANSVDLVFADPPYNLSNGGFTVKNGKRAEVHKGDWDQSKGIEADFNFHLSWIKAIERVLKPGGSFWISGTYHSIYQCGYALQRLGMPIVNEISWYKPNGAPNLSCRCFTASHESLIWARKQGKEKHTFNYQEMKNGHFPKDSLKKPNKQMRSVWSIPVPGSKEKTFGKHPTQKPLDLLRRIVAASSNKGDVVLDPFSGSGTTGVAALEQDRQYIGIELEKSYLDLSIQRIEEVLGGLL